MMKVIYTKSWDYVQIWHLPMVNEGCLTSHNLKWGPLSPNEVVRITHHFWKEKSIDILATMKKYYI